MHSLITGCMNIRTFLKSNLFEISSKKKIKSFTLIKFLHTYLITLNKKKSGCLCAGKPLFNKSNFFLYIYKTFLLNRIYMYTAQCIVLPILFVKIILYIIKNGNFQLKYINTLPFCGSLICEYILTHSVDDAQNSQFKFRF